MNTYLKKIIVYPIKSLDGVELAQSSFNNSGGLKWDRLYALKTKDDIIVNAKNFPEILKIRAIYDLDNQIVSLRYNNSNVDFSLVNDVNKINSYFSDFFDKQIELHKDETTGFPDDTERPGPTVYSLESLERVHSWFPELSVDEIRRRFRGNLELSSESKGFWEDDLLRIKNFKIGTVDFKALKACPRCPVPSMDSHGNGALRMFQKTFTQKRSETLNPQLENEINNKYVFAINTLAIPKEIEMIKLGEKLIY